MNESSPWDDISIPDRNFNVRRVAGTTAVPCYWGLNIEGDNLFIMELVGDNTKQFHKGVSTVRGIEVDLRDGGAGIQRFILTLSQRSNIDLFSGLCRTLVYALKDATDSSSSLAVALTHINRWKIFLSGCNIPHLSPEEVRGLFTELTFLLELLDFLPSNEAVSAWRGPDRSHQDFIFGNIAVEIKSLSGVERSVITISSEDQLESQNDSLFLKVYRLSNLENALNARSLNEIVGSVQNRLVDLCAAEEFGRKLVNYGYAPMPDYDSPAFVVSEILTYRVEGDFPKLVRSEIPCGVIKIRYDIKIESIAKFKCDQKSVFGGV